MRHRKRQWKKQAEVEAVVTIGAAQPGSHRVEGEAFFAAVKGRPSPTSNTLKNPQGRQQKWDLPKTNHIPMKRGRNTPLTVSAPVLLKDLLLC